MFQKIVAKCLFWPSVLTYVTFIDYYYFTALIVESKGGGWIFGPI